MRTLATAFVCLLVMAFVPTASAQDYGVGETVIVPLAPDSMVIDGVIDPDVWDLGASFNLLNSKIWWAEEFPEDITNATAQVLFATDTLYIHVFIEDSEVFVNTDEPWQADQIYIGIDPVHEAGVTDALVDQDDWAGWPDNAPGAGPHAYKIYPLEEGGAITLNFDPDMAAQYARGVVYRDSTGLGWGIEAAFYVPGLAPGVEIGFNVGGAQAKAEACDVIGECAYGYFSRWSTENPGGDIYSRTDSYGTLRMAGGQSEGYGSGVIVEVPVVAPGAITIDGQADEEAWANAQADIDATAYWNPYGAVGDATPSPDLVTETRLLWSDDTLYVYHLVQDIELFWGGDTGSYWNSDMVLLGLDASFEGDSLFGPNFDGGIENAPRGPFTYFINVPAGFTIGWNEEVSPADSGWVNAVVFVDEANLEWGFEAAIYVPGAELGKMIGFDIGGAQASIDQCEEGLCDYAYFSWQSGANGVDPGTINRDASQWATLLFVEQIGTAIEKVGDEIPAAFTLEQNYPNPFNPTTSIRYNVAQGGDVRLAVYDVLGRHVVTLVEGAHTAGTYEVQVDASNWASGMYVYVLEAGGKTHTRKMMLLK